MGMSRLSQIRAYKNHLEKRYKQLIEKSNAYKFIDENESDIAAFKAMRIRTKLDQISYLDDGLLQSLV